MDSARKWVMARYPEACVVRSMFGLIVMTDQGVAPKKLGEGRAFFEEEAWLSAWDDIDGQTG